MTARLLVVIGLVVVLGALAGCDRPGGRPSSPATTDRPSASQTPKPEGPRRLWSVSGPAMGAAEPPPAVRSQGVTLLAVGSRLRAIDDSGTKLWSQPIPRGDDVARSLAFVVAGDTVVVSHNNPKSDRWPQPLKITARHLRTGKVSWTDSKSSFVAVYAETVYTTRCNQRQDGGSDNCTVTARRITDGTSRWRTPAAAGAKMLHSAEIGIAPKDPKYLAIQTYPSGPMDRTIRTLDSEDGSYLGVEVASLGPVYLGTRTIVFGTLPDQKATDGCRHRLYGVHPKTGDVRWRQTYKTYNNSGFCSILLRATVVGELALGLDHQGRPMLFDLSSGKVVWRGNSQTLVAEFDRRRVVTVGPGPAGSRVSVIDLGSKRKKMSVDVGGPTPVGAEIIGDRLIAYQSHEGCTVTDDDCAATVFELGDGSRVFAAPGVAMARAADAIVTRTLGEIGSETVTYAAYAPR